MTLEDPMPVLVSPGRIAHIVPNKAALDPIVGALGLSPKAAKAFKGSLAQLAGFNTVGSENHNRSSRDETDNWQRLQNVQWCRLTWCSGRTELVPLVGKPAHKLRLAQQHDPNVKSTLKNLLCRAITTLGKDPRWELLSTPPAAVASIPDGTSLVGIAAAQPAAAQLPDWLTPNEGFGHSYTWI